jgi:uncharacterized membrane-anchored protein YhcB (DUF1043 family)
MSWYRMPLALFVGVAVGWMLAALMCHAVCEDCIEARRYLDKLGEK